MDPQNLPFVDQTPTQPQQDEGVPFNEDTSQKPLPPQIADERANKADYGLRSKLDISYPTYYNSFVNGQEPFMRDYIVNQLYSLNDARRQDAVTKMMREKGGLLSQDDLDSLSQVTNDPGSVIEDHYAVQYMNAIKWPLGKPESSNWLQDYWKTFDATDAQKEIDTGSQYQAILQFGRTRMQDAEVEAGKQSWLGWGVDMAKEMSGIYQILKAHPSGGSWSLLAGNMREEFVRKLWTMGLTDYPQMKKEYDTYIATLNPSDQKAFAHDFLGMGTQEKMLENVFPMISVETGVAGTLAKGFSQRQQIRTAVRQQILKEVDARYPELSAAAAAGNIKEATVQRTWGDIINRARRADPVMDALEDMPYLFRAARTKLVEEQEGYRSLGLELGGSQQLIDQYDQLIKQFPELVSNLTRPERVPNLAEKYRPAIEAAQEQVIQSNVSLSSRIWNLSEPYWDKYNQAWFVDMILGKNSQEAFGSSGHAGRVAAEHGLDGFKIIQGGSGFYITKPFPVQETGKGMRDMYAVLKSDRTPNGGVLNSFLSRLRTPNETLSSWMSRNREAASFANSVIERYAFEQAEAVRKIAPFQPFARQVALTPGSKRWNDFERVLNAARDIRDPNHPKNAKGYTFQTVGELQYNYMKMLGRLPDNQEVAAYFSFKRIQEMDHALRTIDIVRNKYRNGVMSHRFFWTVDGQRKFSQEFDAIKHSAFPRGSGSDSIAIIDENGKATVKKIGRINNYQADSYDRMIKSGQRSLVRVWAPSQNPLLSVSGIKNTDQIVWVMAHGMSDKPLDWTKQLPWRGGGHFIPKWNQYIKQIAMKHEILDGVHHWYATGVNTLMPVVSGVEGRNIIKHLEEIRQLLQKPGRMHPMGTNQDAARDIVENKLHMDWKEVYGWFRSTAVRGADGRMQSGPAPLYNLTEPFQLVNINENLINKDMSNLEKRYPTGQFTDSTKHGDMSLQYQTEYSQERDVEELKTLHNTGTIANPTYSWSAAPLLDAIPTMNRSFTRLANTTLLNDMKAQAVETWIREAMPALKAAGASESELQSSPLYWFHNGKLKPATDINDARISELETARLQTQQFIGQVSEADAIMHVWTQKLVDSLYERFPGAARWLGDKGYDDVWTAHQLSDPSRFFRSVTFHLKMGLFAIPQLFVQGQTYTNIFGIAGPIRATQGTTAAMLMQYSRLNPSQAMLLAMDKHAGKFGWRGGTWMAARKDAMDTGFFNVGREYSLRDDPMSNKIIKTLWGNFLDFGALPFTEGEKNVRYGAWFTAWKEYSERTGKTVMNNADKLEILNRAALLNGNMNRASNALFQRGWGAFPSQFFTYTIRQAELIWGKRLTGMEKTRLLAANAFMYGIPVGLGITGLPSDVFRQNMIKNGYTPGDNQIESFFTEGAVSQLLASMTGTYSNVGERFGTTGATPVYDFLYGDKTAWEMSLGASGTTMQSVWEAFDPFRQKIMATLRGDPNGFNIMPEHYLQIAKEAGSINNTLRAAVALQTGKLFSKKGEELSGKMDMFSSILMGITGLQPQEATDFYLMSGAARSEKQAQDWARNRFIQEFHRGLQAYDNNDTSNGNAFMTNAFAYSNLFAPDEDKDTWLTDASKGWETVIDRVRESFGTKHVPPELKDIRLQQYIRGLQVNG
jgi:hypothetical protein